MIRPPELSGNYWQRHLLAEQGKLSKGTADEFCLWSISFILVAFFDMLKNLGTDGFTSPLMEGVLRICIALKINWPRPGLNPLTLGPIVSMLTTPPRATFWYMLSVYIQYYVHVCGRVCLPACEVPHIVGRIDNYKHPPFSSTLPFFHFYSLPLL
jgi:hypothetical protein